MQVENVGDGGVVGRDDVSGFCDAVACDVTGGHLHGGSGIKLRFVVAFDFIDFIFGQRIGELGADIVLLNIIKLEVCNVRDGIMDTEAGEHQRGAARNAENHHDHALFKAENVAQGDLVQEFQALPQRRDALEENAFAGGRGLRADEVCRHVLHLDAQG